MTVALVVVIWILLVALVGVAIICLPLKSDSARITDGASPEPAEPTSWLESVTARKLIVHTVDDHSMEGLLVHTGPDGILLDHAKLLGDKPVDLGGRIWIDRAKVLMVQTIPVP